jgi:hypothetical protein
MEPVSIGVEGPTDAAVARRLLAEVGLEPGSVFSDHGGKSVVDTRLARWNEAARRSPWFVLRDLDRDAECAPELVARLLPAPAPGMCFRIAVREVDAWLLGDRRAAARWLGVSASMLPLLPEAEPDPKQALINFARRSSLADVRRDLVPRPGSSAGVGRGYLAQVVHFVQSSWRPQVAAENCPSLRACLAALRRHAAGR